MVTEDADSHGGLLFHYAFTTKQSTLSLRNYSAHCNAEEELSAINIVARWVALNYIIEIPLQGISHSSL